MTNPEQMPELAKRANAARTAYEKANKLRRSLKVDIRRLSSVSQT